MYNQHASCHWTGKGVKLRWLGGACGLEETVPHLQGQLPLSSSQSVMRSQKERFGCEVSCFFKRWQRIQNIQKYPARDTRTPQGAARLRP